MGSLPSSGEDRVRQAKRRLVLELFRQRGLAWDRIREVRERWGIEASTQMPPPNSGQLYTPEFFGPPPEEQFGEQADQWYATHEEWTADLSTLYNTIVPEEARDSKYPSASGWEVFLSVCVLFDPPETQLEDFAEAIRWKFSNVRPRGGDRMSAQPIVWLRDDGRAEITMMEFYEGLLAALLEEYVHPQGVTTKDAMGCIREERPEIFERLRKGLRDNESRPYIDVRPYHRQEEIESAIKILVARHETRPTTGRNKRDELTAVQCAIFYDRHNPRDPTDKRRLTWTYERLAKEFGLESWRAAKEYVRLGRQLLKN